MLTLSSLISSAMLVTALSIDAFVSSFAYGTNKIKIPLKSVVVINIVCKIILGSSLFFGSIIGNYLPNNFSVFVSFIILFFLGITKIFDSTLKSIIKKYNKIDKKIHFSISSLNFILNVYANPVSADIDKSKILSPKEAAYLAVALSFDGLAVGIGAGMTNMNHLEIIVLSLISDMIAVIFGCYLGNSIAEKSSLNFSWLSGIILLVLAFAKLT